MLSQVPNEPISYSPPDEVVQDTDKTETYFTQMIRYLSTYYNLPRQSSGKKRSETGESNTNDAVLLNTADEIRSNFQYYFGRQDNIDYNYITQDATGNTFQTPWVRGKHAAKLVDFMKGPALQTLQNLDFIAKTIDPETMADKQDLFGKVDLKKDLANELEFMKQFGIEFNPIDENFELPEEYEDWKEDFQSDGEILASNTAEEIYELENAKYKYINAWLHCIVGGIGSIYNYVENGRAKKKFIPSWARIFDNRRDSDFLEYSQFEGFIENLSIGEIVSRWKDKLEEIDVDAIADLKAMAKGEGTAPQWANYLNQGCGNFDWVGGKGNNTTVACVTMFWLAPRDVRFKKSKNRFGDTRVVRMAKTEKEGGDFIPMDVHMGTLIGNKYLVDWGFMKNVVRDFKNKGNPILPISSFCPNMTMGELRATMSMLRQNQDEIDRLSWIIKSLTGKDVGKALVFRTPLSEGLTHTKIMDELKNIGATVIPYNGEMPEELRNQGFVEVVDMSQVQHVESYIRLRSEEERMMEEILNLSKMALGQTNTYVSKGAQQNSVAYSSMGTAYLYDGFIHFIEKDMQYSINQQKMLYAQGKQDEMVRFMTSRAGQKFIKVTKDMRYEDVRIFLKVMDIVDTQARDRILSYAQAWSQNPTFMVDPIDILMLEREKTWTGMIRKLTYSMKKKKNEAMKQQQYQQMLEQVNAEKQQQAMLAQEGMRQSGANNRAMLQGQIKQDGDAMKHMQTATPQQASPQ